MIISVETSKEKVDISLSRFLYDETDSKMKWSNENSDDELMLTVIVFKNNVIEIIKDKRITTSDEDIRVQMTENLVEVQKSEIDLEASGIESTDETEQKVNKAELRPYNPELIRVDTKPFTIHQMFKLIEDGDVDFSPDFQRHFVWKESERKSRLIESIMLRIPLPVFYLAQDDVGKFQIVDGLQRLTVIRDFLKNTFKLRNLEYLKECEGKYFNKNGAKNIDPKFLRRIEQATLTVNIIDPQTPVSVKFEIFKRINEGGKPLKAQEIRNCMSSSSTRTLLNELSNSEEFKNATDYSISGLRMEDQELILRFCAFYLSKIKKKSGYRYNGNMELFLDEALEILNNERDTTLNEIKKHFLNAMRNAFHFFGKYAFRKCLSIHLIEGAKKQFINKSLFTTWSVLLCGFENQKIKKLPNGIMNLPLAKELENDSRYLDCVTNGTNDVERLNYAFETTERLIQNNIEL
jgi:hypothetical protein